ncbi:uncharacterized protein LOC144470069 [Augochlora pura]
MTKHATRTRDSKGRKRCLLLNMTDFELVKRPMIFLLSVFGFFPYDCKSEEYVFSKKKFVYLIIAATVYVALVIYNLLLVNFLDTSSSIMETMPENFFVLLDGSIPLLLYAAPFSLSTLFAKLSMLSHMLSRQDFSYIAKITYTVHGANIVCFAAFIPLYVWKIVKVPLRRRFINLYLSTVSSTVTLFYLPCVCILGACYKKLNENLIRLNGSLMGRHIELTEKQLSRRRTVMLLTKVKYYEEMHEKISDTVDYLNTMFRMIHIIFTTATFVVVTFDLYSSFAECYRSDEVITINMSLFFEGLAYVALRFGKFCVVVWVCETAANHAAEITTTIHDCVNDCADDAVKLELKYFALQVMHRDITFTTKAFNINRKLISQILSAVLMYMIILYQFLMTSNCTN